MTADTLVFMNNNDAVLGSLLNSLSWANRFTSRLAAMHACHRHGPIDHFGVLPLPQTDHAAPSYAEFEMMKALAGNFTSMALNASVGIEIESELL
jgi:hypothetical protein